MMDEQENGAKKKDLSFLLNRVLIILMKRPYYSGKIED